MFRDFLSEQMKSALPKLEHHKVFSVRYCNTRCFECFLSEQLLPESETSEQQAMSSILGVTAGESSGFD